VHRWLQYRKLQVTFRVSPECLQTFIGMPNCVLEDRVQYSTVHIPNVVCDGHLQIINFCTVIVRCTETFWLHCIRKLTTAMKLERKQATLNSTDMGQIIFRSFQPVRRLSVKGREHYHGLSIRPRIFKAISYSYYKSKRCFLHPVIQMSSVNSSEGTSTYGLFTDAG
jgi:hypothetical protein